MAAKKPLPKEVEVTAKNQEPFQATGPAIPDHVEPIAKEVIAAEIMAYKENHSIQPAPSVNLDDLTSRMISLTD